MTTMTAARRAAHEAQSHRRVECRNAVPDIASDTQRDALLRILRVNGFTARDVAALRAVNTGILTVLVQTLPPDMGSYLTWAEAARRNRMTPETLREVLALATMRQFTAEDVVELVTYGKGEELAGGNRTVWLAEHLRHGNKVEDVRLWGKRTPAWIVAWHRTCEMPDVPEVALGEERLWQYMELAMKFPSLPESVVAHTLTQAPNPYGVAETPGAWLLACWNPEPRAHS